MYLAHAGGYLELRVSLFFVVSGRKAIVQNKPHVISPKVPGEQVKHTINMAVFLSLVLYLLVVSRIRGNRSL